MLQLLHDAIPGHREYLVLARFFFFFYQDISLLGGRPFSVLSQALLATCRGAVKALPKDTTSEFAC